MMYWLQRSGLKTARAWRMKERLREVLREARAGIDPIQPLKQWVSWARAPDSLPSNGWEPPSETIWMESSTATGIR